MNQSEIADWDRIVLPEPKQSWVNFRHFRCKAELCDIRNLKQNWQPTWNLTWYKVACYPGIPVIGSHHSRHLFFDRFMYKCPWTDGENKNKIFWFFFWHIIQTLKHNYKKGQKGNVFLLSTCTSDVGKVYKIIIMKSLGPLAEDSTSFAGDEKSESTFNQSFIPKEPSSPLSSSRIQYVKRQLLEGDSAYAVPDDLTMASTVGNLKQRADIQGALTSNSSGGDAAIVPQQGPSI